VPLAALALIEFGEKEQLRSLAALVFWLVWQFYCSIYVGYFLGLLLIAFAIALAVGGRAFTLAALAFWPRRLQLAWLADIRARQGALDVFHRRC
jgi:hypothetical protein